MTGGQPHLGRNKKGNEAGLPGLATRVPLWGSFSSAIMQFTKHWAATLDDYVIDLAWSPDGSLLAAASAAGGVTLYDSATGAVRHSLPGHEDGTNCVAWMPVGRVVPDEPHITPARPEDSPYLLATGGQDGCVRF